MSKRKSENIDGDGTSTTQPSKKTGEVKVVHLHNKYRLKLVIIPARDQQQFSNTNADI
jgi:hypothetical protein